MVNDRYEWLWLYAAIEPTTGKCTCLLMPHTDIRCLEVFLRTVAEAFDAWTERPVAVVLDNSGSHTSGKLNWPDGLRPLPLPPSVSVRYRTARNSTRQSRFFGNCVRGCDLPPIYVPAVMLVLDPIEG